MPSQKLHLYSAGCKFGFWTVIDCVRILKGKKRPYMCPAYLCQCICGTKKSVNQDSLISGRSKSCGCKSLSLCSTNSSKYTHRQTRTRLYGIWSNIKSRCTLPSNNGYKHYGARGIHLCAEWMEFEPFAVWARKAGYKDSLTIERQNVNGDYTPSNCEWIVMSRQQRNKRATIKRNWKGVDQPIIDIWESEKPPMSYSTFRKRINAGWNVHDSLSKSATKGGWIWRTRTDCKTKVQ